MPFVWFVINARCDEIYSNASCSFIIASGASEKGEEVLSFPSSSLQFSTHLFYSSPQSESSSSSIISGNGNASFSTNFPLHKFHQIHMSE
jgi:Uri superfamily endonuclease